MALGRMTFASWFATTALAGFAITSAFDERWRDAGESGAAAAFTAMGALLLTRKLMEEKKRLEKAHNPLPTRRDSG